MAKGKFEGTLCDLVERKLETTRRWCLSVSPSFHQENKTSALEKYPPQRRKFRMAGNLEIAEEDGVQ